MSRRQPKLVAVVLTLSLLLAALPALAQGRPAAGAHGAPQAADWLRFTWKLLSGLWSGEPAGARALTSIRGHEGGSLDPDGKPRTTTPIVVTPTLDDEGASLDPHG